jgi:hypothetical protein
VKSELDPCEAVKWNTGETNRLFDLLEGYDEELAALLSSDDESEISIDTARYAQLLGLIFEVCCALREKQIWLEYYFFDDESEIDDLTSSLLCAARRKFLQNDGALAAHDRSKSIS